MSEDQAEYTVDDLCADAGAAADHPEMKHNKELPQLPMIGHETRTLMVILSDDEVLTRSKKLAARLKRIDDLTAEKSVLSATIKKCKAEVDELRKEVEWSRRFDEIECNAYADYDNDEAVLIRTDTGEEVSRRQLKSNERQQELELDDDRCASDEAPEDAAATDEAEAPAE